MRILSILGCSYLVVLDQSLHMSAGCVSSFTGNQNKEHCNVHLQVGALRQIGTRVHSSVLLFSHLQKFTTNRSILDETTVLM